MLSVLFQCGVKKIFMSDRIVAETNKTTATLLLLLLEQGVFTLSVSVPE